MKKSGHFKPWKSYEEWEKKDKSKKNENKETMIKKIGKRTKEWIRERAKLKRIYKKKGIMSCEICGKTFGLSWHHRHRRYYYYKKPELLSEFNQTLLLDLKCHQMVEWSNEKHKYYFNKLRGKEV